MSNRTFQRRPLSSCLIATALILLASCNGPNPFQKNPKPHTTREELREELDRFTDFFEASVRTAAEEIADRNNDSRMKRLGLIWQMQTIPKARDALDQPNPLAAMIDLWTLSVRQREYLETGDGKSIFGENQQIAVKVARDCESHIEKIAEDYATDKAAAAKTRVYQLSKESPIRGTFSTPAIHIVDQAAPNDQVLTQVLSIPLVPFRALSGMNETAESIRMFALVAGRMTGVVQGMAADARLQAQLLLLETEELRTVKDVSKSIQEFSQSAKRLVEVSEKLPEDVRIQLTSAIDDVNNKTNELQSTLKEARITADQVSKTAQSTAYAGDALADAASAIEKMVDSFRTPSEPSAAKVPAAQSTTAPSGRPFDPVDYTDMADAFGKSAREFQSLSSEIRGLTRDPALDKRLADIESRFQTLIQSSQQTGAQITDHLVWRLFQLVGVIFVLVVIYRLVVVRILPRHA